MNVARARCQIKRQLDLELGPFGCQIPNNRPQGNGQGKFFPEQQLSLSSYSLSQPFYSHRWMLSPCLTNKEVSLWEGDHLAQGYQAHEGKSPEEMKIIIAIITESYFGGSELREYIHFLTESSPPPGKKKTTLWNRHYYHLYFTNEGTFWETLDVKDGKRNGSRQYA